MKFIVLEGLDGAGKSTQIKFILDWFSSLNLKYKYLHFPRTETPFYGEMVARFLRGDFGDLNSVDPYLVALLYAGDRRNASQEIENALKNETYVIVDRYVYSNIAYQCAKVSTNDGKNKLKNWILDLEFNFNKIAKPDISIFLDVPLEFTKNSLTKSRNGADRDYLQGKADIHEVSINFQMEVKNVYNDLLKTEEKFFNVNCYNENNEILEPNLIFNEIKKIIIKNKIVVVWQLS